MCLVFCKMNTVESTNPLLAVSMDLTWSSSTVKSKKGTDLYTLKILAGGLPTGDPMAASTLHARQLTCPTLAASALHARPKTRPSLAARHKSVWGVAIHHTLAAPPHARTSRRPSLPASCLHARPSTRHTLAARPKSARPPTRPTPAAPSLHARASTRPTLAALPLRARMALLELYHISSHCLTGLMAHKTGLWSSFAAR